MVVALGGGPVAVLITEFAERYANVKTRPRYVVELTDLFSSTGRTHPRGLREAEVLAWCSGNGRPVAKQHRPEPSFTDHHVPPLVRPGGRGRPGGHGRGPDRPGQPLRRIPRFYGKVQGKNPARRLTHEEAFGPLLSTCQDGGEIGLRDELVLRLGLAGMRAAEIIILRMSDLHPSDRPAQIRWIGQARRPRQIVPGRELVAVLDRYLSAYRVYTGRTPAPDAYVVCRGTLYLD